MKRLLLTTAVASLAASSVLAGAVVYVAPPTSPVVATTVATPHVTDWSGFYAGLSAGGLNGDGGDDPFTFDGTAYGAFAGYNMQRGAFVYGGELAYTYADTTYESGVGSGSGEFGLFDLKARAGYSLGTALVYLAAGGTFGVYSDDAGYDNAAVSGYNYGIGAEYKFGEHMFVGVEYLARDVSIEDTPDVEGASVDTFALRAGWHF